MWLVHPGLLVMGDASGTQASHARIVNKAFFGARWELGYLCHFFITIESLNTLEGGLVSQTGLPLVSGVVVS